MNNITVNRVKKQAHAKWLCGSVIMRGHSGGWFVG